METVIEALDEAIRTAGGQAALAGHCGVVQGAVANWKNRKSVPPQYCTPIEENTGVMRWRLRPNDWFRIWPDLRTRPDAPAHQPISEQAA